MKDVAGQELQIGDVVVTNVSGYTYTLTLRIVTGFTPKKIKLNDQSTKFPEQVAKVIKINKEN